MLVRDNDFVSEVGLMGSGLQIWLQMVWFITKTSSNTTLILDEPDIYLHPDLQGKIYKLINSKFNQVIIATHSIELISNVDPSNLLILNKRNRILKYANSPIYAQQTIENLGSMQNLSLMRLSTAKKVLFVEGQDIKLLEKFKDILYPDDFISLNDIPCVSLGGFSRFKEIIGTAKLFEKETHGEIKVYCILDSDYHLDAELQEIYKTSNEEGIFLHIWKRKELENYIFNIDVLYRFINSRNVSLVSFENDLNNYLDQFKEDVIDEYTTSIQMYKRKNGIDISAGNAAAEARELIKDKWNLVEDKISLINGKNLIKETRKFLKDKYSVSVTKNEILNKFASEDVNLEVKEIIDLIK